MMVMVTALVDGAEGAAGVEDPPPPPHDREQSTTADAAVRTSRRRIRSPFLPLMPVCLSKSHTRDCCGVLRVRVVARYTPRKRLTPAGSQPPTTNQQPPPTVRGVRLQADRSG